MDTMKDFSNLDTKTGIIRLNIHINLMSPPTQLQISLIILS